MFRRLSSSRGAGLAVFLLLFALAPRAAAYCRTMTCDPMKPEDMCQLDKHDCVIDGDPLFWPGGVVEVWVDSAGTPLRGISGGQTVQALRRAYAQWLAVECENGDPPALDVTVAGQINGAVADYDKESEDNENVVLYQDIDWPYGSNAVAITTMTFDVNTGQIVDGDTELNSRDYELALEAQLGQIDLQAVLTHECGHVLGLAHTDVEGATMQAETRGFGFMDLRSLEVDDRAGICDVYDPVHDRAAGCVCSMGRRRADTTGYAAALGAFALALTRYRRRR